MENMVRLIELAGGTKADIVQVNTFGNDPSYRWGWVTPIVFSSVTPNVVYSGANVLFKSTDRGGSWKPISPDLTKRINRDTIYIMGKAVGTVNYSPGAGTTANPLMTPLFGTITYIAESPLNGQVLYTGTDDGQVTDVTPKIPGLPPFTFTTSVTASHFAAGRVYATFDGHFNHDDGTYVYVSNDFGQTWKLIIDGLPKTSIARIVEDPRDGNVLVVGHARGVSFSNDGGEHWQSLNTNMPTVPVRSVVFQARDNSLVAGTYGRGVWILDDATPLERLTSEAVKRNAFLVSITRGRQWEIESLGPTSGEGLLYLPNPEFDPTISYFVRDGAASPATIVISNAQGQKVRTLNGPAARGLNHVTWDMHMDSAVPTVAGAGGGRGGGGGGGRGNAGGNGGGPLVLPGKYTVAITVPGVETTLSGSVNVESDPIDAKFSEHDRQVRQDAILQLYALQRTLVSDRAGARALEGDGESIKRDVSAGGAAARADSLNVRVQHLAAEVDRLIGVAGTLMRTLESFNAAPTIDQRAQMVWAMDDATWAVGMLNHVIQSEIPALYAQAAKGSKPRSIGPLPLPVAPAGRP